MKTLVISILGAMGMLVLAALSNSGGQPLVKSDQMIDAVTLEQRIKAYIDPRGSAAKSLSVIQSAQSEIYRDTTLPFLSHLTDGRTVYRVLELPLSIQRTDATPDSNVTWVAQFSLDIIVDAVSGQLIKAHNKATCDSCFVPPDPPSAVAEEQLQMGHERYFGFPTEPPELGLAEILSGNFGIAIPYGGLDVTAEYLLYGRDSSSAIPAWVISLKGLTPVEFGKLRDDVPTATHMMVVLRTVVDASTGRILRCNNRPSMPPDWKPPDTTMEVRGR